MAAPLPPIDRRDARRIERQILGTVAPLTLPGLRDSYTPGWTAAHDSDDVGVALTGLFARLMELLIDRLNRAPFKHQLAFLDLLGIDRLPGNPARTPVRFFLPAGNTDGGFVRAGTQVVSSPGPSGRIHVFETAQGLDVTPVVMNALMVLRPDLDAVVDGTAVIDGKGGPPIGFGPAAGVPIEHALYLADHAVLGFDGPAELAVEVSLAASPAPLPAITQWAVAWERFVSDSTGTRSWQAMTPAPGSELAARLLTSGTIVFPGFAGTEASAQGLAPAGGLGRWIRARLTTPLVPAVVASAGVLPEIESVRVRLVITRADLPPDAAFFNSQPIDLSRDFQPFGPQPRLADTFYLASDEAFSRPGAIVTLRIDLSADVIVNPSSTLQLRWETWIGTRWDALVVSDGSAQLSVGSTGIAPAGEISFTIPPGVAPTMVNGVRAHWVRVRIAAGHYGAPAQYIPQPATSPVEFVFIPDSFQPPSLSRLAIDYLKTHPLEVPEKAQTLNTFEWRDARPAFAAAGLTIAPFLPAPDTDPAMYLGFDGSFGDRLISLFVDVREDAAASAAAPTPATLEYSVASGSFATLDLESDGTNGLAHAGLLSFFGRDDQGQADRFGLRRHWVRVRLATAAAGRVVAGVHLNTVEALNRSTITNETLGSAAGVARQTLSFSQVPVFEGEQVFVREPERPPDEELAALVAVERSRRGREPTAAEIKALVQEQPNAVTGLPEIWVRWHAVGTFLSSGPRSRHYVIDRVAGVLAFGDGQRALLPPIGRDNVRAFFYQAGGGSLASREVKAGGIKQLRSFLPFVDRVLNLLDASGGSDPETVDAVAERGPQSIKNRDRAVTSEDYVWLARQASTLVHQARCLPTRNGQLLFQPGAVAVLIVPDSDDPRPRPSLELMRDVRAYLAARALPLLEDSIFVVPPLYHDVRVQAEIVTLRAEEASLVEGRALAALNAFLHPVRGGPRRSGWEFGRHVRISEIHQVLEDVAGVDVVLSVVLNGDPLAIEVDVQPNELPVAGTHELIMRPPAFAG
jgi:hypothetical protein